MKDGDKVYTMDAHDVSPTGNGSQVIHKGATGEIDSIDSDGIYVNLVHYGGYYFKEYELKLLEEWDV